MSRLKPLQPNTPSTADAPVSPDSLPGRLLRALGARPSAEAAHHLTAQMPLVRDLQMTRIAVETMREIMTEAIRLHDLASEALDAEQQAAPFARLRERLGDLMAWAERTGTPGRVPLTQARWIAARYPGASGFQVIPQLFAKPGLIDILSGPVTADRLDTIQSALGHAAQDLNTCHSRILLALDGLEPSTPD